MQKIYRYKGFEVTVALESPAGPPKGVWLLTPPGFIAVVRVQAVGDGRESLSPIRLTADDQCLFPTEAEAFMAGYSAAQRLIDDMLTA